MPRFCRKCGAALAEGVRFCRLCGTPTGALESGPQKEEPQPTTPIDRTQPMTTLITEPTGPVQPTVAAQPLKKTSALRFIGGAALLLIVALIIAGAAFFFGLRWSPQSHQGVKPEPAATQPPPVASEHPPTSLSKPPAPPKKPASEKAKPSESPSVTVAETGHSVDHLKEGHNYLNAGRYREALAEYQKAQHLDPMNQDVYYYMGLAHFNLKEFDEALQAFQKCTSGQYADQAKRSAKRAEDGLRRSKK